MRSRRVLVERCACACMCVHDFLWLLGSTYRKKSLTLRLDYMKVSYCVLVLFVKSNPKGSDNCLLPRQSQSKTKLEVWDPKLLSPKSMLSLSQDLPSGQQPRYRQILPHRPRLFCFALKTSPKEAQSHRPGNSQRAVAKRPKSNFSHQN